MKSVINLQNALVKANERIAELEDNKKELLSFVRDVAFNYDCDADAHRYGTPCRACGAFALLQLIDPQ